MLEVPDFGRLISEPVATPAGGDESTEFEQARECQPPPRHAPAHTLPHATPPSPPSPTGADLPAGAHQRPHPPARCAIRAGRGGRRAGHGRRGRGRGRGRRGRGQRRAGGGRRVCGQRQVGLCVWGGGEGWRGGAMPACVHRPTRPTPAPHARRTRAACSCSLSLDRIEQVGRQHNVRVPIVGSDGRWVNGWLDGCCMQAGGASCAGAHPPTHPRTCAPTPHVHAGTSLT